ncbi:MAG: rhodanese-like domain-containing protein [Pseudomonadota bacterium]
MIKEVEAKEANRRVLGEGEVALLDLREAGPFSEGHPLFAVPAPYSTLEAIIGDLVPRPNVPILLFDGGDGIAKVGASVLAAMGYTDIGMIRGGPSAWSDAGLKLYKGVNVPSKTLGELAEAYWHPKTIGAPTLATWWREGRAFLLFDCRPPDEFQKMTVPGARCLPNGEIAYRLPAIDQHKPIVVTCAGRTRGIIGTLGLARLAPDREIYALDNGTQGWALAGFDLERGKAPTALPELSSTERQQTRRLAEDFLAVERIPVTTASDIVTFLEDKSRTTFLFDVRSSDEAAADPLPAFRHVWSGQIVQATDRWIGVHRARIVLADDYGLRAGLAAFWLRALGHKVYIAHVNDTLRNIAKPTTPAKPSIDVPLVDAATAIAQSESRKADCLDLRPSWRFTRSHLRDSRWTIRPHLKAFAGAGRLLLIGDDGPEAELGARELLRLGHRDIALIRGGFAALVHAGATIATGSSMPLDQAIDLISFAYGRHDGDLAASQRYLDWERGLVSALSSEERAVFRL